MLFCIFFHVFFLYVKSHSSLAWCIRGQLTYNNIILFSENFVYANDGSWSYPPQSSFPVSISCLVFLFFLFFLIFLFPFLSSWVQLGLPICTWLRSLEHEQSTRCHTLYENWLLPAPSTPAALQLGVGLCEYTIRLLHARALTALILSYLIQTTPAAESSWVFQPCRVQKTLVCSSPPRLWALTVFLLWCLWCSLSTDAGGVIKTCRLWSSIPQTVLGCSLEHG